MYNGWLLQRAGVVMRFRPKLTVMPWQLTVDSTQIEHQNEWMVNGDKFWLTKSCFRITKPALRTNLPVRHLLFSSILAPAHVNLTCHQSVFIFFVSFCVRGVHYVDQHHAERRY